MKYCIIGAGAFGINIAYELLSKGHQVEMITDKLESVSSIYSRGIAIKFPNYTWFTQIYLKMINNNYRWFFLWLITTFANSLFYMKYKKKAIVESYKIIKSYDLNYQICQKKYFIDIPHIHNEMIDNMKNNTNFTLTLKKVSNEYIQQSSNQFHKIFDCRGSNNNLNYLCENIGGYKVIIKANSPKKCFSLEDGWFVHTDINNKNQFIAKGGLLVGSKRYHQTLNTNDKNEFDTIANIIKNKPFWKKYNCEKIIDIQVGTRMYSIDMLPFYSENNNIVSIMGGSAVGCVLAPYTSKCMVEQVLNDKKISPFDFSYIRPRNNYINAIKYIVLFIIFLFLLKRNYKHLIKRYIGIKL
jgi:hypothetical protein